MTPSSCGTRFANVISRSRVVTMKITIECDRDRVTEMVVNQFIRKNTMMFLCKSHCIIIVSLCCVPDNIRPHINGAGKHTNFYTNCMSNA